MSSTTQTAQTPSVAKKRFLSSPVDSADIKKQKPETESLIPEDDEAEGGGEATMLPTLSEEHIAQICDTLKSTMESQVAGMVTSITDDVLGGLKKKVSDLEDENALLKDKITILEKRMDSAEQYSRRNCLRISGIPETKEESVDSKFLEIASSINADLSINEIDRAHRVGKPRMDDNKSQQKPRDIIVKFVSYRSRQKVMKKKSDLKAKGFKGVYVNEDLTRQRNSVFFQARKLVKEKRMNGTWAIDGVIFIKDNKFKVHRIKSQLELDELASGY